MALATIATGALLLLLVGGSASPRAHSLHRAAFTVLSGPPLSGATHLWLIAGNGGAPYIVDVDRGTVRQLPGLGVNSHHSPPDSAWISPAPGGALVKVIHEACLTCVSNTVLFTVRHDGSVRRIAAFQLSIADSAVADFNATAEWVLAHERGGDCTLRLVPGSAPAVRAPCGTLDYDTPLGLLESTGRGGTLSEFVDPQRPRA